MGDCLQMGIGRCNPGRHVGLLRCSRRDLGIHTEMFSDERVAVS